MPQVQSTSSTTRLSTAALDKRVARRVRLGPQHVAIFPTGGAPHIRDLSLSGAFLEDRYPLPVGTSVNFGLHIGNRRLHVSGIVRRTVPGNGMGVQFTQLDRETRDLIERFLDVEGKGAPADVPPAAAPVPIAPAPTPAVAPRSNGSAVPASDLKLTPRLEQFATDLAEVELALKGDQAAEVDARVLAVFREAVDHIRQTAWAVQEWLHLQEEKGDSYAVLPLLTADRLRRAAQILGDVVLDIDASEVTAETEGVDKLRRTVERLQQRFARFDKA